MKPTFFRTPADFRKWLAKHHATAAELLVGYYKIDSGKPSLTWPESVDEALCFGWIDGVRRRVDDLSYTIRFTPRRPKSIWSAVNVERVRVLTEQGLMQEAGLKSAQARIDHKSRVYSYEQLAAELDAAAETRFRENVAAWKFFQAQPPWYRKKAGWWVTSAKQEATRARRLEKLIELSAQEKQG